MSICTPTIPGASLPAQQEVDRRLEMFNLCLDDRTYLVAVRQIIAKHIDQLADAFYSHLGSFVELSRFVATPEIHRQLRKEFQKYLLTLGLDCDRPEYLGARLQIGSTHERIGLPIKGYLGAYAFLQEILSQLIMQQCNASQSFHLLCATNKIILLDVSLAVEAYHNAALSRSERLLDQLEHEKEEIRRLAETDHLTGLLNRRRFIGCLEMEAHRTERYGSPLCLLMIDLDNFKSVNDRFGHDVGDSALQAVSKALVDQTRKGDLCGRLGGEEFVAALVETDLSTAELVAERLRLAILHAELGEGDSRVPLSASIGIALWTPETATAEQLLKSADIAMYAAKASGKNCVRLATVD